MDSTTRNPIIRGLRQIDRSFWCLHDHFLTFAILGFPTLIAAVFFLGTTAIIVRTWDLDIVLTYLLWSLIVPVCVMTMLTFLPLPCAAFAWFQAKGEPKTAGECFAWCGQHAGRLFQVLAWLVFSYTWWFLLFGIPMLFLWARTCQAPLVALFEDHKKIFRRSRQLTREDGTIHILAALFVLLTIALGALIPVPRLVLNSRLFEGEWTRVVGESLWIFESTSGILLICAIANCWCVSLALLYHDIRQFREGEAIQKKISRLREMYAHSEGVAS